MSDKVIHLSLLELESLLRKQREAVSKHITRNLTVYSWFNNNMANIDIDKAKEELAEEADGAPPPTDFLILERYLK